MFFGCQSIFSQDYMQKIAQETCTCVAGVPDTLKGQLLEVELGICMIKAATPYQKKLKKDIFAYVKKEYGN